MKIYCLSFWSIRQQGPKNYSDTETRCLVLRSNTYKWIGVHYQQLAPSALCVGLSLFKIASLSYCHFCLCHRVPLPWVSHRRVHRVAQPSLLKIASLREALCLIVVQVRVTGPKIASLSYCCHVCSCHMMLWNSLLVLIVLSNCTGNICGCEGMLSVKAPKLMLSIKAA